MKLIPEKTGTEKTGTEKTGIAKIPLINFPFFKLPLKSGKYLLATVIPLLLMGSPLFAADYDSDSTPKSGSGTTDKYDAGDYIDDAALTSAVKLALLKDPILKSRNISVETTDGVVQLSGRVESLTEQKLAMSIAQNVQGVKSVKQNLDVKER